MLKEPRGPYCSGAHNVFKAEINLLFSLSWERRLIYECAFAAALQAHTVIVIKRVFKAVKQTVIISPRWAAFARGIPHKPATCQESAPVVIGVSRRREPADGSVSQMAVQGAGRASAQTASSEVWPRLVHAIGIWQRVVVPEGKAG